MCNKCRTIGYLSLGWANFVVFLGNTLRSHSVPLLWDLMKCKRGGKGGGVGGDMDNLAPVQNFCSIVICGWDSLEDLYLHLACDLFVNLFRSSEECCVC